MSYEPIIIDHEKEEQASRLRGSLLEFTRYFYEYIKGREFTVVQPIGRESRHITCCKILTSIMRLDVLRAVINIPPGGGKSTLLSMWTAWALAHYPDCNFLYISYSHELAAKHTAFIRSIISSKMFRYLFDVEIDNESRAKDSFSTTAGGTVKAFGSAGSITGQDAGLPHLDRFSGAVILDDVIKPNQAHSDTIRERVISNYDETVRQRCRGLNVPIVYIGQRVHEADLADHFLSGKDIDKWESVILPQEDIAGNILCPDLLTQEQVDALKRKSKYVWAAQHQQNPLPAGGGLFEEDWFCILDEEPDCYVTFITADTAETEKSWNDATVFSFWGLYDIETLGKKTGQMGLHWLDCVELRVEPKDLKDAFIDFYTSCMRYPNPPLVAAIEKKSTGVTLISILQELRGMQIRSIERNRASEAKTQRFIDIQSIVASKIISFTKNAKHMNMCIKHMTKITANNSHRYDDIADTLADAINIGLIEKSINFNRSQIPDRNEIMSNLNQSLERKLRAKMIKYS